MGRMKEELMKREEADWIAEEQEKWLNDTLGGKESCMEILLM